MKKLFENWRKQINEAEYEDPAYASQFGSHLDEPEQYSDVPELSFQEQTNYVEAWRTIGKAVENGTLPESVEDVVLEMLGKLGIYL
tara:strand:- start:3495 stop:3752 length:258 start_codon:yes stop_codon:yes gene_type:complete